MSGFGLALYTDEDVDVRLAIQLRHHGYDVVSSREIGASNRGISDEDQLRLATDQRRAILTHNIDDFQRLDVRWKEEGRERWGIIVIPRRPPLNDLFRRVRQHLDMIAPEYQRNTLLYLPQ